MFENFSFDSSPSKYDSPVDPNPATSNTIPLTPPLSPRHSPAAPPVDSLPAYKNLGSPLYMHHDALASTLFALAISPAARPRQYASPEASDCESEPEFALEDVRRKRQSMARMQTNDDLLRQLGELVKRVSPGASRKPSPPSLVETSGITKRSAKGRARAKPAAKPRDTNGSGRRVAA